MPSAARLHQLLDPDIAVHVQVEQKGYYEDEIDAARAHDVALIELRGPDAVTNFPLSDYAFDFESWKKRHPEVCAMCMGHTCQFLDAAH